ncbi:retrovirus-related pol polyprotein from transposon TNT 1-94 [Tanacetum coccineum]
MIGSRQTPSRNMKNKVEAQPRKVNKKNCVVKIVHDVDVKHSVLNTNSEPICATCKKSCLMMFMVMCLLDFVKNVNSHAKSAKKQKKQNIWKPTGHVFTKVGLKWKPTGKTFTIVEPNHTWGSNATYTPSSSSLVMTWLSRLFSVVVTPMNNVKKVRFAEPLTSSSNIKQVESSKTSDSNTPVLSSTGVKCSTSNCGSKPLGNKKNDRISQTPSRNMKNKVEAQHRKVVQIVLWYLDSGCSKHMTRNHSQLMNFVSKFLGTVRFENDQIARIMGYGDYQLGNVGQFCDADLEVAFRKNTCFIRNLEGVDLLLGSRDTNLYTISLNDMLKSSLICLLSKASKTKSWLWHHRLSHLNFGTLNKLAKDGLARGIPRLKFQKDHLCSACALGKSKKSSHQPKAEDTNQEKLYLLHMDLCGPMRVASINEKRYILVIVDDCRIILHKYGMISLKF